MHLRLSICLLYECIQYINRDGKSGVAIGTEIKILVLFIYIYIYHYEKFIIIYLFYTIDKKFMTINWRT